MSDFEAADLIGIPDEATGSSRVDANAVVPIWRLDVAENDVGIGRVVRTPDGMNDANRLVGVAGKERGTSDGDSRPGDRGDAADPGFREVQFVAREQVAEVGQVGGEEARDTGGSIGEDGIRAGEAVVPGAGRPACGPYLPDGGIVDIANGEEGGAGEVMDVEAGDVVGGEVEDEEL